MGLFDELRAMDKTGRWLVWLTIGGFALWPLGTALGLCFRNEDFLSKALSLPAFLLLFITIGYIRVFTPARRMWRKYRSRREDENGASPEGGGYSDQLPTLLSGLGCLPPTLWLGLAFTAVALGDTRIIRSFGQLLFVTGISCWVLIALYALVFEPLHSLFKYLARRKAGPQADAAPKGPERTAAGDAASEKSARERREREQREREERLKREREEREQREQREREERARREREEARQREERQRREEEDRRARFSSRDEQAFALLGLEPGAKFAAIKKAYRKLVVQYHPDKVGHLGEEYRRIATEKTKEINAAYRYLEERFGK